MPYLTLPPAFLKFGIPQPLFPRGGRGQLTLRQSTTSAAYALVNASLRSAFKRDTPPGCEEQTRDTAHSGNGDSAAGTHKFAARFKAVFFFLCMIFWRH